MGVSTSNSSPDDNKNKKNELLLIKWTFFLQNLNQRIIILQFNEKKSFFITEKIADDLIKDKQKCWKYFPRKNSKPDFSWNEKKL